MATEQTVRKTKQVLGADALRHPYNGDDPKAVYIVGEVKKYETKDEPKTYRTTFRATYLAKDDPKFDEKKAGRFTAITTQPLDLSAAMGKKVLVSGQTFRMSFTGEDGKEHFYNRTFVRSIKEGIDEKRQDKDGNEFTVVKGGADIMPSSIAAKDDVHRASEVTKFGYFNGYGRNALNREMTNKNKEVYQYATTLLLGKKGEPLTEVRLYTEKPLPEDTFKKDDYLMVKGAVRVDQYYDKNEKKSKFKDYMEALEVNRFPEKEMTKDAAKEVPANDAVAQAPADEDVDGEFDMHAVDAGLGDSNDVEIPF